MQTSSIFLYCGQLRQPLFHPCLDFVIELFGCYTGNESFVDQHIGCGFADRTDPPASHFHVFDAKTDVGKFLLYSVDDFGGQCMPSFIVSAHFDLDGRQICPLLTRNWLLPRRSCRPSWSFLREPWSWPPRVPHLRSARFP